MQHAEEKQRKQRSTLTETQSTGAPFQCWGLPRREPRLSQRHDVSVCASHTNGPLRVNLVLNVLSDRGRPVSRWLRARQKSNAVDQDQKEPQKKRPYEL